MFAKTSVIILTVIYCWSILFGNSIKFLRGLNIFIAISLALFLLQQVALYFNYQSTRWVTIIPYIIAIIIYLRLLIRPLYTHQKDKQSLPWRTQDYLLAWLIALSLIQIFNPHIGISAGIRGFFMGPFWMAFYFVGRHAFRNYDYTSKNKVMFTIIICIGLSAVYGIVGLVIEYPWQSSYMFKLDSSNIRSILTYRMGSTIGLPAVSGMAGMISFLITLSWLPTNGLKNLTKSTITALALILTIASGSRSVMLGLIVGLGLILMLKTRKTHFQLLLTLFIILFISLPFFLESQEINPISMYSMIRLKSISPVNIISGEVLNDESLAGRFEHWSNIIPQILDKPFGQGVGSWHQVSTYSGVQLGAVADNEYLALAGELGFLGLVIYLTFVGSLAQKCWFVLRSKNSGGEKHRMWATITMSTLLGVSVMAITAHPLYIFPSTMLMWLLWGIGSYNMDSDNSY